MLHAQTAKDEPFKESPAMKIGSAVHTLTLEPELFAEKYHVMLDMNKRLKGTRETIVHLESMGITVLNDEELTIIQEMSKKLLAHPIAGRLLKKGEGIVESALYWTDPTTGLQLKIKPDFRRHDGIIVDIKTSMDAGKAFARKAFDLGYHTQAAMYTDGCIANGIYIDSFAFVVIENDPPFDVVVYYATPQMLNIGRQHYIEALKKYNLSLTEGIKGYSNEIIALYPPSYLIKNAETIF